MTSREIAYAAHHAIDTYEYPAGSEGLMGGLWDPSYVQEELLRLRDALVVPSRRRLLLHGHAPEDVWLVAVDQAVAVYFDERMVAYGLGSLSPNGEISDWGVHGDLVGTFMAR